MQLAGAPVEASPIWIDQIRRTLPLFVSAMRRSPLNCKPSLHNRRCKQGDVYKDRWQTSLRARP